MKQKKPRYFDFYRKQGMLKALTLFDAAQRDERPLRFKFYGPEAEQAHYAVRALLEGGVPGFPGFGSGMDYWHEASMHGVRRRGALVDRKLRVDPTPVLKAIRTGGGINSKKKRQKKKKKG